MNGELEHVCTGEKGFRRLKTATELRNSGLRVEVGAMATVLEARTLDEIFFIDQLVKSVKDQIQRRRQDSNLRPMA